VSVASRSEVVGHPPNDLAPRRRSPQKDGASCEPLAVFGAGWVGLVTAVGFAELGHPVTVRDVVPARIAQLQSGIVPIHEPGLSELLTRNMGRLTFTLHVEDALAGARVAFVCVGTPATPSGDADLSAIWRLTDEIGATLGNSREQLTLVMKSTVPVGTGDLVAAEVARRGLPIAYVANPEFLAEGTAVADFRAPSRIVIGSFGGSAAKTSSISIATSRRRSSAPTSRRPR
jgi:UDPglucose 6-dehydrogenase